LWLRRDIAYVSVIIWAFWAIVVKRQAIGNPDESIIVTTIYAILVLLLVVGIFRFLIIRPKIA